MKEEKQNEIREAMEGLDEATNVPGMTVLALVLSRDKRGKMDVYELKKGDDKQLAHKLYECIRYSEQFPFDIRGIITAATAKWLAEQSDETRQAFDRLVERCKTILRCSQELKAVIDDCRSAIDEVNGEEDASRDEE